MLLNLNNIQDAEAPEKGSQEKQPRKNSELIDEHFQKHDLDDDFEDRPY